ncbi:MAG: HlyD family efflux transporter periplasmic adaptor subunit [Candidatus Nanopelagicales bacterium]|nr:HlyD family efflux transporter periplasmic adaptor subunit [Candidatus Nanopelagicales bacterium]
MVSPIQKLDDVALFGSPRMWVVLLGAIALIMGFLTWGVLARPPVFTSAEGVISTVGGPLEVGAALDGTVDVVFVSVGTAVEAGNTLAILLDESGQAVRVRTPVAGTVIEVATQDGGLIRSGSGIATIQRVEENLVGIALVPASKISGVIVGQSANISPNSIPAGQYGYITGVVSLVAETPMSVSRIQQLVGGVAGYQALETVIEPLIEVQIELGGDDSNPSGLAWTIGTGPDYSLVAGTPWNGQIITGNEAPLAILFGSS